MSSTAMNALKDALQTALPGRVVTRDLLGFDQRKHEDLQAGVLTLVAGVETDFANYRGREADLGNFEVKLIGQLVCEESAANSAVEDAEFDFAGEVKAFLAGSLPVSDFLLKRITHSEQGYVPYGWFVMELKLWP